PKPLKDNWAGIERRYGVDLADVEAAVQTSWAAAVHDYLIDPNRLYLAPPGTTAFECARCRRRHLNSAGGVCTNCQADLPDEPDSFEETDDYYAYLARSSGPAFRLHCEELTGQTDRPDAQRRQAQFQDIFLDDELERV